MFGLTDISFTVPENFWFTKGMIKNREVFFIPKKALNFQQISLGFVLKI